MGTETLLNLHFPISILGYPDKAVWSKTVNECLLVSLMICFVLVRSCFSSGWRVFGGNCTHQGLKALGFLLSWQMKASPFNWSGWIGKLPNTLVFSKCELSWTEGCSQLSQQLCKERVWLSKESFIDRIYRIYFPNCLAPKFTVETNLSMFCVLCALDWVYGCFLCWRWMKTQ